MAAERKLPELTAHAPNKFKISVAVDFGTDGLALAYAIHEKNQIRAHAEWSNTKYEKKYKPKTIILLDENGNPMGFGLNAKNTYMNTEPMKDKWMLFERFKMALHVESNDTKDNYDEKEVPNINKYLTATNGKTIKASIVFIAAFKYLQKQAKTYLKKSKISKKIFKQCDKSGKDIQWIITVPAIWNDAAKLQMRQWIIDAGLVDPNIEEQCKIVYEPECAALAIQYQINKSKWEIGNGITDDPEEDDDKKEENELNEGVLQDINVKLLKGQKYMLIDAGGGTTDFSCHEILADEGEYGVKEVLAPSGGAWGSRYIDDQFVILLEDIFSTEWIQEFQNEHPNVWVELLNNFQNAKEDFDVKFVNMDVLLPDDFLGFIQDKLEEQEESDDDGPEDVNPVIKELISKAKVFGESNLVDLLSSGKNLMINERAWWKMFDHVMDPTIAHIHKLLDEKIMEDCKYLFLAGGLTMSPYFQNKVRMEFGQKSESKHRLMIIIPARPLLSVVEGAAYFAITENYVKGRVLRYTYGTITALYELKALQQNISQEYIAENKFYHVQKKAWIVKDCFAAIVKKGQTIYTGKPITRKGKRLNSNQKSLYVNVMVSTMQDPKIMNDAKKLGHIRIDFPNNYNDDMEAILKYHFYDTMIKVDVYRTKEPDKKEAKYITNYT